MTPPDDPFLDDPDDASTDGGEPLRLLRVVERLVNGNADPESDGFLTEVVADIARHTTSGQAVLSLVDPSTGLLEVRSSHGFGASPPSGLAWIEDGIHGWVRRIGSPIIVDPGTSAPTAFPLLDFERGPLVVSPIRVGGTTLGALSVLRPLRPDGYGEDDLLFLQTVGALLGGMVGHRRAELRGRDSIRKTIESLTLALDARDPYTRGHSQRVAMYSVAIANELEQDSHWSFVKDMRNSLLMSALLHDIGKIGIRDEILFKPDKLTDEEYALIKTHPTKGAEIVRNIPGFDEDVIAGILQHHERWDGKGYPDGIAADKIHIFGRIIGLADAFDAIVTSRPYHAGAPYQFAMGRVQELAGAAFDPEVVKAMLRAFADPEVWNELGSISDDRPVDASESAKAGAAGADGGAAGAGGPDVTERTLRRIFGRSINELPTLPHVVSQILEKTRNSNTRLDDLVNLISTDQALVSMFLKLVNSAFYGFSRRITTLKQAITLLGFRSVRNVVVNAGVVGIFRKRTFNNRYRLLLWDHSVACAVCARILAEKTGYNAREEAFTAGLLHDIGKIVIDQYAPKDSAFIMAKVDEGASARDVETERLGVDHTKIGVWIAERWHLPKTLCAVIEWHHEPERGDAATADAQLLKLVATANALSKIRKAAGPQDVDAIAARFAESPENLLKLDPATAHAVLTATWEGKADAMRTFGGMSGDVERAEGGAGLPAKA